MLVCDLLIPILMIIIGNLMRKHPPAKINGIIGYRTPRSMKNTDTWKFAHGYCGRLWWKYGWILLIPSFAIHLPFYHGSESAIGTVGGILCTLQCIILIFPVFLTEKALKEHFTEDGKFQ